MRDDRILVVDDDPKMRKLIRTCLEADGLRVSEAEDQASALRTIRSGDVALVTLDLNLGAENGFDLAREIARDHQVPIIMVTGRGDVIDRVVGLELGADDYIVKPFHPREMVARVRSVLRRSARAGEAPPPAAGTFAFDGMHADPSRRELLDRDGALVELTGGDFRLLEVFLEAPGRVLSRDAILDRLHGRCWSPYDRSIDNQVARLRKKIEVDPANPRVIKTVRGIGYTMAVPVSRVQGSDGAAFKRAANGA
jgi:DNA-binding response OmpR family regulator